MRLAMIFAMLLAATGCKFSAEQQGFVDRAVALQVPALGDPRFAQIMRELDAAGAVTWDGRLSARALDGASRYSSPLEWMLARYGQDGGLPPANIRAWRKWNPLSSTTASTDQTGVIRLNLWNFNRSEAALANTFVHEQNHRFGLIHPESQRRAPNHCDPGYLAGDLAEALVRSNAGGGNSPHGPVCPALCAALSKRGLWTQASCRL